MQAMQISSKSGEIFKQKDRIHGIKIGLAERLEKPTKPA